MRLVKPTWLHHDGNAIFSIDIHPDGTKVVTGGQGKDSVGRVVIWNMAPILAKDADLNVPTLLCQLDHHSACVNSVRWNNSGNYLSSGGDDRVIIVWKLFSKYKPNQNSSSSVVNNAFGATSLEQWRPHSMLRSHTGDVLDLAWSPDDRYLASASVDNTVIIWDAENFPQIAKIIRGHESFVKGVTWDPIGTYLATQSDDKTLKIWRVSDWALEHCVQEPFQECGGTTHVLRLHWAPDGVHLVSAHAMNGGGPTAQIVERREWKTDKDFVGHRRAVVCVKFNGNIMQSENSRVKHTLVALGSRDRSVSIWSTSLRRPVVVINDIFTNSVMDLTWSPSGKVLMACSGDGTVAVAYFSWEEIGKPLSEEEKVNFYQKLYGKKLNSSNDCNLIQNLEVYLAKQAVASATGEPDSLTKPTANHKSSVRSDPPLPQTPPKGPTDRQIESRTADGRRRITPMFLLPPSDAEQEAVPKNEQTIFMQGKGKDDVVTSNQTSAQDWRKSMVSSIENVKGFETPANSKSGSKEVDGGGKNEGNNNVEVMEVDDEVNNGEASKSMNKLVNGKGPVEGDKKEAKKTEDNTPNTAKSIATLPKDKLVNGEAPAGKVGSTKSSKVVNGTITEKEQVKLTNKEKASSVPKVDEPTPSGKKDQVLVVPPPVPQKDNVNTIPVRRKKHPSGDTQTSRPIKKVKLSAPVSGGEPEKLVPVTSTSHAISGSSLVLPPQRSLGGISPSKADSAKGHHRLPPMKIESALNIMVELTRECSYSLQVTNNHKRPDGICHQVVCTHASSSMGGLEWTICTDAPICGASGDMHRVIILCENNTTHILDTKGRYVVPPLLLSGYPSKSVQSGAFLAVVTTKAVIHIWNTHTKRVVLKSESLLPLLNQSDSEKERAIDIARIQVAPGGLPHVTLSTGKTFMYNLDLTTWLLLSDPRGLVSSPLSFTGADQSVATRMLLFTGDGRLKKKPEPAIATHMKLKLATSMEMKNPEGVKQWTIALAKSLANHGSVKELHQLCEDLLGPVHSSKTSSQWQPTIIGVVDKRKLLREILKILLDDLRYQDFYSEFNELLSEVEEQNSGDSSSKAVIDAPK